MAKTFEALKRAEMEHAVRPEETRVFHPVLEAKPHMPFKLRLSPQTVEEYQLLRRNILTATPDMSARTVLFTSAVLGEGTSTVVTQFGATLASSGERVLLVDANLRNPTLHDVLNVDGRGGLTEVLTESIEYSQAIKHSELQNLSVVSAGISPISPVRLFEGGVLKRFESEMKQRADWVLLDSPPVNQYNDAAVLALAVDCVILVIEAEKTKWEVAESALQRLAAADVRVLGAVLNRRKMYIPEWFYRLL